MVVLTEEIWASVLLIHRRFLRFRIPDVVTNFVCADAFIQVAIRQKQPLAQFVVTEIATSAFYGVLVFAIAVDHTFHTFGSRNIGVVAHLHQNKLAVSSIRFVHIQHRMGSCARSSKGIKNQRILRTCNPQHKFNKASRLRRVKLCLPVKNRQHFFFCFICMTSFRKRPEVCRNATSDIIKICFSTNSTFSTLTKVEQWPLSAIINRSCLLCSIFHAVR